MSEASYEFSSAENLPIRLLARISAVVSCLLAFKVLIRLFHLNQISALIASGADALNYSDSLTELLSVVLPLIVLSTAAYQFAIASRQLGAIVSTSGRDIPLLNSALVSFSNGLYLFAFSMILVIFRWFTWAGPISRCISRLG